MSDTVISVENVSKYYRLGLIGGETLRADCERWWARVRGKPDPLLKVDAQPSNLPTLMTPSGRCAT
jgi:lipopolysaccharide transport system ATP-binding protein